VRSPSERLADGWLRLDQPTRRDEVVTTRAIVVRGEVGDGVAEVWLTLESRTGKTLATRTVRPAATTGATAATFLGRFLVGTTRPTGRVFVTATAVGHDGVPLAATRRRIEVGPLVGAVAVPAGRDVVVRGWVAQSIGDLHVMVASATREPITVSAIDPTGKPRNGMVPFEATVRIPAAASDAGIDLFVVPVDGAGRWLADAETHPVEGAVVGLIVR